MTRKGEPAATAGGMLAAPPTLGCLYGSSPICDALRRKLADPRLCKLGTMRSKARLGKNLHLAMGLHLERNAHRIGLNSPRGHNHSPAVAPGARIRATQPPRLCSCMRNLGGFSFVERGVAW